MSRHLVPYAIGAGLLGATSIVFGDFALQWQPVPATFPSRALFVWLSASILIAGGIGMLIPRTAAVSAFLVAVFFALWVVGLHMPRVVKAPADVSVWLGVAEITALALGGLAGGLLCLSGRPSVATNRIVRFIFAACLAVFGLSHFVYAQFTANMIPEWIPARLFFAYATGAAHLATALSFVSGVIAKRAAACLAAMFAVFVLVLHAPRVFATPASQAEWTMLAVATALTGAAWLMSVAIAASELNSGRR